MSQAGALSGSGSGGGTNVQKIAVQTGTSPVVADASNTITFNGAVVAAGTNPVRTDGTGPNTMALEVQTSQAIASADATKIGLAAFNSADFTVDADGFVSSAGGSGITTIDGDSGSVSGSTVKIFTNVASFGAGASVLFNATSATELTLQVTDSDDSTMIGNSAGNGSGTLNNCTYLGTTAGAFSAACDNSVMVGWQAGAASGGSGNTVFLGYQAGSSSAGSSNSTFVGYQAGVSAGGSNNCTFIGYQSGIGSAVCTGCVFLGYQASASVTGITNSVSIGKNATTGGSTSICIGNSTTDSNGASNTVIGSTAVGPSGGSTICLGASAGSSNSTGSSNITIGNVGVSAETNVIRIGTQGSSSGQQNTCFIAGIFGATTSDAGSTTAVLIDNTGNLGTVASSIRYKENVEDLKYSPVLDLRPVVFSYKADLNHTQQYGLIAEEVKEVMPHLVVYDKEGHPDSVKYHELPIFLLVEIQKLKKEIEMLKIGNR